jgi:hypothetical protein
MNGNSARIGGWLPPVETPKVALLRPTAADRHEVDPPACGAIGILFGSYRAVRASRLSSISALRYEE